MRGAQAVKPGEDDDYFAHIDQALELVDSHNEEAPKSFQSRISKQPYSQPVELAANES